MSRLGRLLATLTLAAAIPACSQAYSDAPPAAPMVVAGGELPETAAPYGVEILAGDGAPLQTYVHGGRYYVLGAQGDRYTIRVTNPTDRRIEAVVTVDGLDVIDGEAGDLRKRGYVVQPRGELRIEGFRTSTSEVATFRFSSVAASYAGRKGKARNVGVIAVAIFEEQAAAEMILEQAPPPPPVTYHRGDDGYVTRGRGDGRARVSDEAEAPSGAEYGGAARRPAVTGRGASTSEAMRPPPPREDKRSDRDRCCDQRRPGLGTEYGEQRYSAATWTRFVRASETPSAVAELRYNDAPGLAALGIQVAPAVDGAEVTRRETADPFPGDPTFSRPPAGIR